MFHLSKLCRPLKSKLFNRNLPQSVFPTSPPLETKDIEHDLTFNYFLLNMTQSDLLGTSIIILDGDTALCLIFRVSLLLSDT